jgi:hypothetical protein
MITVWIALSAIAIAIGGSGDLEGSSSDQNKAGNGGVWPEWMRTYVQFHKVDTFEEYMRAKGI